MIAVDVCKNVEVDMEINIHEVRDRANNTVPMDDVFVDNDNDLIINLSILVPDSDQQAMLNWLDRHNLFNISDLERTLK